MPGTKRYSYRCWRLRICGLLILLFCTQQSIAQSPSDAIPISIGYFGHGAIRPGVKVGVDIPLKALSGENADRETAKSGHNTLYLSPQLAGFSRHNFYTGLLVNAELGIRRTWNGRRFSLAYGIGLGYLNRWEVLTVTADFNGKVVSRERERRGHLLPTATAEIGYNLSSKLNLYVKPSYGMQFSSGRERAGNFFFELGLKLFLINQKSTTR